MKRSSGILLFRKRDKVIEYFLVRPGGPFYRNLDKGIWTIPKGIIEKNETEEAAAIREFREETGQAIDGKLTKLDTIKLRKSKYLTVFSVEGTIDEKQLVSNTFTIEYPKQSGKYAPFPEIEKGDWFTYQKAIVYIHPKLIRFLDMVEVKKIAP